MIRFLGICPSATAIHRWSNWQRNITPNGHAIASNFVDLDNFYDTSEVSYDGWSWSTSAMGPDILIRQTAVNYCFRAGVAYESEGDLRGINLNYRPGTLAANVVPGVIDTDAPDGPGNAINGGYLWSAAFNAGLSFREYGADGDTVGSAIAWPASIGVQQTNPSFALLNNSTNYDVDFRAYDLNEDDTYRYQEWNYDVFTRLGGNLPALSIFVSRTTIRAATAPIRTLSITLPRAKWPTTISPWAR